MNCMIPGSFDPVTFGHIDIIARAVKIFDSVVVAILKNPDKPGWLDWDTRAELIRASISELDDSDKITVVEHEGLLVECAKLNDCKVIARGLRTAGEFGAEAAWASINYEMSGIDTFFLASKPEHAAISSSAARELLSFGASIERFVPAAALSILLESGILEEDI
ncbi:phosphopantetheine adenylyltransferase [Clostridia bacterium]|nr:phosphopantetheine adenylyltransferase [Clostridia bacterium]